MTNVERIRNMNEEELIDFLGESICDHVKLCPYETDKKISCDKCRKIWLHSEVIESDKR